MNWWRSDSHNEPNSTLSGSWVCKIKASGLHPFQLTQQGNLFKSTVNKSALFLNCLTALQQKIYSSLAGVAQISKTTHKNVQEGKEQLNTNNMEQQMGDS